MFSFFLVHSICSIIVNSYLFFFSWHVLSVQMVLFFGSGNGYWFDGKNIQLRVLIRICCMVCNWAGRLSSPCPCHVFLFNLFQLKSLGCWCGLVSENGPNSEELNRTVDLLAGLGTERPETGRSYRIAWAICIVHMEWYIPDYIPLYQYALRSLSKINVAQFHPYFSWSQSTKTSFLSRYSCLILLQG